MNSSYFTVGSRYALITFFCILILSGGNFFLPFLLFSQSK